jgi:bacillithiol biosynthesis cysteine-adding enzyme BshC
MKNSSIQFDETGVVKPLMQNYLDKNPVIEPFIGQIPSLDAFQSQIKIRRDEPIDRPGLVNVLSEQYQGFDISELTRNNIESLISENTFTVTTGHQPCLFTGPLYFVIKILNTIKLADLLNKKYPDQHIVPVYWMGAEDHDFEEVNHFKLYNKVLTWESNQIGSVGRFNTAGLEEVHDQFCEILNDNPNSEYLKSLFQKAYLSNDNYADATRTMVNELFGERGIVIIDGDSPFLKKSFASFAKTELTQKITFKEVSETNKAISAIGKAQVNPREINLFYLDKNNRRRIIADGDYFIFDGEAQKYSLTDVLELLELYPERFSPNVLMRPLYQEAILPNLAYIGGMGEMAYWLQLKSLFAKFNMSLPLLLVRNSFLFLNANQAKKLDKLGLSVKDLFADEHDLTKKIVHVLDNEVSFTKEHYEIAKVMDDLTDKVVSIDPSLKQVFDGEKQRLLKSLNNLEKRAFKALKQKNEQKINQAKAIKDRLFPGGGLQERIDNFAGFYEQQGESLFDNIYDAIDPIDSRLNVLS